MKVSVFKMFSVLSLLTAATSIFAGSQDLVTQFLKDNEVAQTSIYCRSEIPTMECRTIMLYRKKNTNTLSRSFQISFSAPFRQAQGTEYFLQEGESSNYIRIIDSTVNGTVDVEESTMTLPVVYENKSVVIQNIKFGTIVANLSFSDKESLLKGYNIDPKTQEKKEVNISYVHVQTLKAKPVEETKPAFFPENKVWMINKVVNNVPLIITFDLREKGFMNQTATCNHADGSIQTVSAKVPVEINEHQIINRVSKTERVNDAKNNWCQVIVPVRTMTYQIVDDSKLFIKGDPNNPSGIHWNRFNQ